MIKKEAFTQKIKELKKTFRGQGINFRTPNINYDQRGFEMFILTKEDRYAVVWVKDYKGNILNFELSHFIDRKIGWKRIEISSSECTPIVRDYFTRLFHE
ncbi:MAG: hypothetical protein ACI4V7_02795 [Succinivibrionaceae bacterium]